MTISLCPVDIKLGDFESEWINNFCQGWVLQPSPSNPVGGFRGRISTVVRKVKKSTIVRVLKQQVAKSSFTARVARVSIPAARTAAGLRMRAVQQCMTNVGTGEAKRSLRDSLLELFIVRYNNDDVREHWQTRAKPVEHKRPTPGHSHGVAASKRTSTARMFDTAALQLGRPTYVVSSCRREMTSDPAYHGWHIDKDLVFPSRNDAIPKGAIVKMVDVDYYINWKQWMHHARPVMMYTFVPQDVRYSDKEYSYALTPDGVSMHVNGGSTYEHGLWDYSNDHVAIRSSWWKTVVCSVDVKNIDLHHRAILLNPVYSVRFFGGWFSLKPLKRMRFAYGADGVTHSYRTDCGDVTSVGLLHEGKAVTTTTLAIEKLAAIKIRLSLSKHPCVGDVEKYLRHVDAKTASDAAPPLFKILMTSPKLPSQLSVTDLGGVFQPLNYTAVVTGGMVCEDGKNIGRQLCPSIVTYPNFIPQRCGNNDIATVAERVVKVANRTTPPIKYQGFAREFIKLLIPQSGFGFPLELSEIIEEQSRPTQRGRSEKVKHWMATSNNLFVQAFMKGESYSKTAAPRNISTVPTEHTLELSTYTYAFKRDVLIPCEWYSPGKKPAEIANRVVKLASGYPHLIESDYSAYDGTKSLWMKENIEHPAYLAWADYDHKRRLHSLLKKENSASAMTSMGLSYHPEASQLSGSPTTTDGNSISNCFVTFAAHRLSGLNPEESWASLGAYAGDDGLSTCEAKWLCEAAEALGLKLKCEVREGSLTYLGRVFYDAHVGNVGSIQDPERTWSKLHLSFAPSSIPDRQALANRAAGYLSLDPVAPVTSDWCLAVQRILGLEGEITSDGPYVAWIDRMRNGAFGGWPQMDREHAYAAISWRTGRDQNDVRELARRLQSATALQDFADLWTNPEPKIPITVEVNGEIREGDVTVSASDALTKHDHGEQPSFRGQNAAEICLGEVAQISKPPTAAPRRVDNRRKRNQRRPTRSNRPVPHK